MGEWLHRIPILNLKLITLNSVLLDGDLEEFLPPMEEILEAPELGSLTTSKSFQFLLKLGYEHLYESLNQKQWIGLD